MASSDGDSWDWESGEPEEGEYDRDELRVQGGWVPPEQRAWRHPSETGAWARAPRRLPSGRRARWATALVGAGTAAVLVGGGLMLATKSQAPAPSITLGSPPVASTRSVVRLTVERRGIPAYGCGVVVARGGLVATDATLLRGATRIVATTARGRRERARVLALDPTSDVGLVRVAANLPVARFVDWSALQPGSGAVELAVATRSTGGTWSTWQDETIASIGDPVGSGPGSGMVSVVAATPTGTRPDGAVLLERDGAVVGLLDRAGVSAEGRGAVYLPGEFVSDVARELAAHGGQIHHGWLGIEGSDSGGSPRGALVTEVNTGGPSSGHLQPGDVITAIDGRRVRSMADLRSRLYLLAPGASVVLTVRRSGASETVQLVLGASP